MTVTTLFSDFSYAASAAICTSTSTSCNCSSSSTSCCGLESADMIEGGA